MSGTARVNDETVDRLGIVPIAEQIARFIKNRVQFGTYAPGARLPGELALAEEFEVSRGTIRKALGALEQEGLIARRQGLGTFVPATKAPPMRSALAISFAAWDDYVFFPEVIRGASQEASSRGYAISVFFTGREGHQEQQTIAHLMERSPAGLLFAPHPGHQSDYTGLMHGETPIVQVDQIRNIDADYVVPDNFTGARLALEHLHQLGHRSILHITHNDAGDIPTRRERLRGFRETCAHLDLEESACPVVSVDLEWLWEDAGGRATREVLAWVDETVFADDTHTACLCYNDNIATLLLRAAHLMGKRVPEDLSIIGFDDSVGARTSIVPLTSVNLNTFWIGKFAARMLIDRIEGGRDEPSRGVVVPVRLEIRQSTARARS